MLLVYVRRQEGLTVYPSEDSFIKAKYAAHFDSVVGFLSLQKLHPFMDIHWLPVVPFSSATHCHGETFGFAQ